MLILRATASVLIFIVTVPQLVGAEAGFFPILISALAIFIALGLFTTTVSGLVAMGTLASFFSFHNAPPIAVTITTVLCISLSMMGAGAYSFDALLFGQRRVTLPNR